MSSLRDRLCQRLKSDNETLATEWLKCLRQQYGEAPRRIFPGETLLDHIPELIWRVGAALQHELVLAEDELVRRDLRALARLRRAQGYAPQEILGEFEVLHDLLLRTLGEACAGGADAEHCHEIVALAGELHRASVLFAWITTEAFDESAALTRSDRAGALSEFARAVAHELNNRLHGISMEADLLASRHADVADAINTWNSRLLRLDRVVEDVLTLAIADDDHIAGEGMYLPLSQVVESAVRQLEDFAGQHDVTLVTGELPEFQVDAARCQLILLNLITNGIKYHDPDKPDRLVSISAESRTDDREWRIDVVDNGIGIPDDERERVFEPDVRLASAADRDGEGLGLALAARAAEQLGTRIEIRPADGGGSVFSFVVCEPAAAIERYDP
ncbi:hypothetical protein BH24PSE2_BH24PSE2_21240 [soil metagenome]